MNESATKRRLQANVLGFWSRCAAQRICRKVSWRCSSSEDFWSTIISSWCCDNPSCCEGQWSLSDDIWITALVTIRFLYLKESEKHDHSASTPSPSWFARLPTGSSAPSPCSAAAPGWCHAGASGDPAGPPRRSSACRSARCRSCVHPCSWCIPVMGRPLVNLQGWYTNNWCLLRQKELQCWGITHIKTHVPAQFPSPVSSHPRLKPGLVAWSPRSSAPSSVASALSPKTQHGWHLAWVATTTNAMVGFMARVQTQRLPVRWFVFTDQRPQVLPAVPSLILPKRRNSHGPKY